MRGALPQVLPEIAFQAVTFGTCSITCRGSVEESSLDNKIGDGRADVTARIAIRSYIW
jgi:hypothetical protein